MIRETLNRKNRVAITSDRWHVVRAHWSGDAVKPRFVRSVVSEHEDRAAAVKVARQLMVALVEETADNPPETRDQVFVRRPDYKSLKTAKRVLTPRQ